MSRLFFRSLQYLLLISIVSFGQYAAFYPTEIFFTPVGIQNRIPADTSDSYSTFSALRISLNKDLPSSSFISNKFIFSGSVEKYHQVGLQRDYMPLYLNPVVRSHFFLSDIITLGVDFNGNFESIYGSDAPSKAIPYKDTLDDTFIGKEYLLHKGEETAPNNPLKMLYNRRGRLIPFCYIALTPDLLMYSAFTFGRSNYSQEVLTATGLSKKDYLILKAESKFIYFTPFHIRLFFAPYTFKNNYLETPARSKDGFPNKNNPLLREEGFGASIGARYSTFRWGYVELQSEVERNEDKVFGANSYTKLLFNLKLENQYFTERFGYIIGTEWAKHYFNVYKIDNTPIQSEDEDLSNIVYKLDIMPIINMSRNLSIRPQYDMTYKYDITYKYEKDNKILDESKQTKHRFWLHIHLLW